MNEAAKNIQSRLRRQLIPAVPVPFLSTGEMDQSAQHEYAKRMSAQPIGGVAVWVHTGRGLMLTTEQRKVVFESWRSALPEKVIVCGAGGKPEGSSDNTFIETARSMAREAGSLGADAILAFAPTRFRERPETERMRLLTEYHEAIADAGLPIILFYLYKAAGGISYTDEELAALFAMNSVAGIKMATLDSVMTFQRVANFIEQQHPDQLLITGEDRFLGYSLMMGAESALIGMGAARTAMQADLLNAYFAADHERFRRLNGLVDHFAQVTFTDPMEGYIQRMLRVLAHDGIIPITSVSDPWGPKLEAGDLDRWTTWLDEYP